MHQSITGAPMRAKSFQNTATYHKLREGVSSTPPPLPPLYHGGGMNLRVRLRVIAAFFVSVSEWLCNCAILIETWRTTHVSYFIIAVYLLLNSSLAVRCNRSYTEYIVELEISSQPLKRIQILDQQEFHSITKENVSIHVDSSRLLAW